MMAALSVMGAIFGRKKRSRGDESSKLLFLLPSYRRYNLLNSQPFAASIFVGSSLNGKADKPFRSEPICAVILLTFALSIILSIISKGLVRSCAHNAPPHLQSAPPLTRLPLANAMSLPLSALINLFKREF